MTIQAECVIVGAGPCGLFQVFELGLLGIPAHVVEALPKVGGQCAELYPDKPIYDIPAIPVCQAQELVDRLLEQIAPFEAGFHLDQQVTALERRDDGRFRLCTSAGTEFDAGTVVIAAGVGAFEPVRLKVDGADECEGRSLWYRVADPSLHEGRDVVVLGGGDSALDWALALEGRARSVTLAHRSTRFRAAPASVARMEALCGEGRMRFVQGSVTALRAEDGMVRELSLGSSDAGDSVLTAEHVLVFFGLSPKLGPVADWGIAMEKNALTVDAERFQTSVPGIFAVGDINTYPGKKKLILSGFHEAALAAFAIRKHLHPDEKVRLQYTTTSTALHERLGVTRS